MVFFSKRSALSITLALFFCLTQTSQAQVPEPGGNEIRVCLKQSDPYTDCWYKAYRGLEICRRSVCHTVNYCLDDLYGPAFTVKASTYMGGPGTINLYSDGEVLACLTQSDIDALDQCRLNFLMAEGACKIKQAGMGVKLSPCTSALSREVTEESAVETLKSLCGANYSPEYYHK